MLRKISLPDNISLRARFDIHYQNIDKDDYQEASGKLQDLTTLWYDIYLDAKRCNKPEQEYHS